MPAFDPIALPDAALKALPAVCRRFGVAKLEVFGSAVTGRFDPARSDVDFLVSFDEATREGSYLVAHLGLVEELETLLQRIDAPIEVKRRFALGRRLWGDGRDSRRSRARRSV